MAERPDPQDIAKLYETVDEFAAAMKAKLTQKAEGGWFGWAETENLEDIRERLVSHVKRGDRQMVDVANLAMMIWHITRLNPDEIK